MKGKILVSLLLGGVLMTSVFGTTAFAKTIEDVTDTKTGTVETSKDETIVTASRIGDDINSDAEASDEVTSADGETAERSDAPLSLDGNMALVDDIVTDGGKQFITLTTRDGHYYYLIIDRASNKEQNVYFLNQVDEKDLLSAMTVEDRKDFENEQAEKAAAAAAAEAEKKAQEEAARKAAASALAGDGGQEDPAEVQNSQAGKEGSILPGGLTLASMAVLLGAVAAAVGATLLIVFLIRKRKAGAASAPDPDAGYGDAYDDAYIIEEDEDTEGIYGQNN